MGALECPRKLFDRFGVATPPSTPPDDHPRRWRFLLSDCGPGHKMALCARIDDPADVLTLRRFEFEPPH